MFSLSRYSFIRKKIVPGLAYGLIVLLSVFVLSCATSERHGARSDHRFGKTEKAKQPDGPTIQDLGGYLYGSSLKR